MENGTIPLTPAARARRKFLVGSPVKLGDGSEWKIPALPVGAAGDLLAAVMQRIQDAEADLEIAEARQRNEWQRALETVADEATATRHREAHRERQRRIAGLERELLDLQGEFVALAFQLHYEVTREELEELGLDLRVVRQVSTIVAGAAQVDELREAMEVLKGTRPGN